MIKVYINYPNQRITIHSDPNCAMIQTQHKPDQRFRRIDVDTISAELKNFQGKKYSFASYPERNDFWLEIDFHDLDFEQAVLAYIANLLGKHFSPFSGVLPTRHC
jgi:hypothetical protein